MAGEISKTFLFCILSSFTVHSISTATTEIWNKEELVEINKTRLVILNKASGHSVLMQCDLLSNDMFDVVWHKNDANLTDSSHYHILQSYQVLDNTRIINSRSTLKMSSLATSDSGSYICKFNSTKDGLTVFRLIVAPSNTLDLVLSSLLISGFIFTFISAIYIIKFAFTRRR